MAGSQPSLLPPLPSIRKGWGRKGKPFLQTHLEAAHVSGITRILQAVLVAFEEKLEEEPETVWSVGSRVWGFWKQVKIQLLLAIPPLRRMTPLFLLPLRHTSHIPIMVCIYQGARYTPTRPIAMTTSLHNHTQCTDHTVLIYATKFVFSTPTQHIFIIKSKPVIYTTYTYYSLYPTHCIPIIHTTYAPYVMCMHTYPM